MPTGRVPESERETIYTWIWWRSRATARHDSEILLNFGEVVSWSLTRPGRIIQDLGRQKKICRAVGMPDMPLVMGGAIHAYRKP